MRSNGASRRKKPGQRRGTRKPSFSELAGKADENRETINQSIFSWLPLH